MKFNFLLSLLCGVSLLSSAQQTPPAAKDYVMEKDVAVPMRDGVTLRVDVLRPRAAADFPRWFIARRMAKNLRWRSTQRFAM